MHCNKVYIYIYLSQYEKIIFNRIMISNQLLLNRSAQKVLVWEYLGLKTLK